MNPTTTKPDQTSIAPRDGRSSRSAPVDPRLLRYAKASRGFFALATLIVLAQTAVTVGFAWLVTRTLVGAIGGEPLAQLWPPLAGAAGLVVVRGALIVASETNAARGAARVSLQLRAHLVDAIVTLGPGWLGTRNAAALAVTAGHGLESLDAYFGRYLPQLVATIVTTPILLLVIWLADPISGITVLVTLPLIPVFMVLIGLATRAVQRRQFDTLRRLAARFSDTVGGLGTLKVFGRQHRAADSIETVTRDYARETMTVLRVSFLSGFALEFLASLSVALIAVTIGLRLLDGELSLLIGLFVLLLAPEAYLPLRQVGVQFHAAAEGVAATDDLFAVLDAAEAGVVEGAAEQQLPVASRAPKGRDETPGTRGLVVEDVRVRRGDALLPSVSLSVAPGEVVLVEGPSGAGKSSLVAAILGFAEHDGVIGIDGETDAASCRDGIAWAGQRPGLTAGTVAENVALGDDTPDATRVADALRRAGTGDIDARLVLGATGSGLSGGQAQRVAIARALYRLERVSSRGFAARQAAGGTDTDAREETGGTGAFPRDPISRIPSDGACPDQAMRPHQADPAVEQPDAGASPDLGATRRATRPSRPWAAGMPTAPDVLADPRADAAADPAANSAAHARRADAAARTTADPPADAPRADATVSTTADAPSGRAVPGPARRPRPGILILDEPSSALDAATEAALWRELRATADQGAGILLVSHRTSAREIADRIVRLEPAEVTT